MLILWPDVFHRKFYNGLGSPIFFSFADPLPSQLRFRHLDSEPVHIFVGEASSVSDPDSLITDPDPAF